MALRETHICLFLLTQNFENKLTIFNLTLNNQNLSKYLQKRKKKNIFFFY